MKGYLLEINDYLKLLSIKRRKYSKETRKKQRPQSVGVCYSIPILTTLNSWKWDTRIKDSITNNKI